VYNHVSKPSQVGHVQIDTRKSPVPCTGYIKHVCACIPVAAVHNNTGSLCVRVTLKYEQFSCNFLFLLHENNKNGCQKVFTSIIVIVVVHVM